MGLQLARMITPTSTPFYGIVPGKAVMPRGQITLPVTFGTPSNLIMAFPQLFSLSIPAESKRAEKMFEPADEGS